MQTDDFDELKQALLKSGYSTCLVERIIDYYLHADLKC